MYSRLRQPTTGHLELEDHEFLMQCNILKELLDPLIRLDQFEDRCPFIDVITFPVDQWICESALGKWICCGDLSARYGNLLRFVEGCFFLTASWNV